MQADVLQLSIRYISIVATVVAASQMLCLQISWDSFSVLYILSRLVRRDAVGEGISLFHEDDSALMVGVRFICTDQEAHVMHRYIRTRCTEPLARRLQVFDRLELSISRIQIGRAHV